MVYQNTNVVKGFGMCVGGFNTVSGKIFGCSAVYLFPVLISDTITISSSYLLPVFRIFSYIRLLFRKEKNMRRKILRQLPLITMIFLILSGLVLSSSCTGKKDKKKKETTVVEEKPHFPGGQNALVSYISQNIRYPEEARSDSASGQVLVSFIITSEGKVTDAKVDQGIHDLLDKEALRVVENMPDWEPAVSNGEPIEVSMQIPITFKLD
ncbi:MAG TPA: hypothetical protein DEA97_10945 [Bacteroidales bacterium]|nr:hypothetical protein [Bacteroidales bacterium]